MKKLISLALILFSINVLADSECGPGKLHYKKGKEVTAESVEICRNEYSQFYAKKCAEGCEFLKALKGEEDTDVQDATIGSPGGQICQALGFESRIVEIEFEKEKTPNVDLCFGKDKASFVSTGFLRDLKGSLE